MDQKERIQKVMTAECAWAQAHLAFDLEQIATLMAPEYRRIDEQGRVLDKSATLASYEDGPRSWEIAESSGLDIQLFGPVAIVIGLWHGKGVNKGVPFDYRARFLSIYVEIKGRWLLAAEHSSPIQDA